MPTVGMDNFFAPGRQGDLESPVIRLSLRKLLLRSFLFSQTSADSVSSVTTPGFCPPTVLRCANTPTLRMAKATQSA